mgnify:CR=1 FL=1
MTETITVPIELDSKSVEMLNSVLNVTDLDDLSIFIEDILKKANEISLELNAKQIMKQNPFSQRYL